MPRVSLNPSYPVLIINGFLFFVPALIPDDNSKPLIIRQPQTTEALQGDNVSLVCMASSSSESTMEFTWKKDGAVGVLID